MILSIDVGIKNLAMCVMNAGDKKCLETYEIKLWEVYDIISDEIEICGCRLKGKIEKYCSKKCSFKYKSSIDNVQTEVRCCKTHLPKNIKNTKIKEKKISTYLIQDIIDLFLRKIDYIYSENKELFNNITEIYIELQPKINQRMKMVSHVLFGKLLDIYKDIPGFSKIRFVSASKKLRAYPGPYIHCKLKSKYAQRKWLSIQYTKWFLEHKFSDSEREKWLPCLENKKKSDDMADTFLMTINAFY